MRYCYNLPINTKSLNMPKFADHKEIINFCTLIAYKIAHWINKIVRGTYFLFFLQAFFLPPVARLLCIESREIPIKYHNKLLLKKKHWRNKMNCKGVKKLIAFTHCCRRWRALGFRFSQMRRTKNGGLLQAAEKCNLTGFYQPIAQNPSCYFQFQFCPYLI